jgi:hypothetical protein
MSEGRERKQEKQFEVLRNSALKQAGDDLLSKIPPIQQKRLDVLSTNNILAPGTQVWGRLAEDKNSVEFRAGGTVCGSVDPDMIRELGLRLESCFFEVVSDASGVLTLHVCSIDRKSVQPSTADDDAY